MIFLYHKTSWSTGQLVIFCYSPSFSEKKCPAFWLPGSRHDLSTIFRGLSPPSFLFQVRGHGSRMIVPCCNQSNQSVSRLISVPAAVKVDQEESVEFCDSHSSSAPFEPNVIWRLHTNPRRGKRLYQLFMVKIRYIRKFASPKLMTVGQLVNELGAGKIEPGWLIPHRS